METSPELGSKADELAGDLAEVIHQISCIQDDLDELKKKEESLRDALGELLEPEIIERLNLRY